MLHRLLFSFPNRKIVRAFHACLFYLALALTASAQPVMPNEALYSKNKGGDPDVDFNAVPIVPEGFEVTLVAKEPLVRNPCAIAFDGQGRMFIGQGPQYRKMKPDSPKDSVYLLLDDNEDGVADRRHLYATGFNGIQGLVWRGDDLYIANAPDLTIVRDLDGDDVADEYVKLYTDLGNIEHALHGLNIAPDGRLYMSKGNSKGLGHPGRVAPKAFRELWGSDARERSPDIPPPQVFTADNYEATYHDPNDDWGRMGGILRANPDGSGLEIVSRGLRNPWDINFSDSFDWLGADNDQSEGDRFFRPFLGAHLGWNHSWSTDWAGTNNLPTAPAILPLIDGSTTGVVYYDAEGFPEQYRGFFVGDWLRKVVYFIRPEWDGARMKMAGGRPMDFVKGGSSLLRTTDLDIGADGALYVLSWGTTYGSVFDDGEMVNEGRVWRIVWKENDHTVWNMADSESPLTDRSIDSLIDDLDHALKVRRTNVSEELVRRGASRALKAWLSNGSLTTLQETWGLWTLGRINIEDRSLDDWFAEHLHNSDSDNLNTRLQSIRILGFRADQSGRPIHAAIADALKNDPEARCRQAAAIAILDASDRSQASNLASLLAEESDRMVFYSGWQALRAVATNEELTSYLEDEQPSVRVAALLALLETRSASIETVSPLLEDSDSKVATIAHSFLERSGVIETELPEGKSELFSGLPFGRFVKNIHAVSGLNYQVSPETIEYGVQMYADDSILLTDYGDPFLGLSFIRGFNQDARSTGENFLSFELPTASTVFVAHDEDMRESRPDWLTSQFERYRSKGLRGTAKSYRVYQQDVPAGKVSLGGNLVNPDSGAPINYFVVMKPLPIDPPEQPTTVDAVMATLGKVDRDRGEWLFMGREGAACWTCHQVDGQGRTYGPDLSTIGERNDARHWIESILEPNAIVTEGYATQNVSTSDGATYAGVLVDESDLLLTLRQVTGELVRIRKTDIASRASLHGSLMPSFASTLAPRDIADLVAYLGDLTTANKTADRFSFGLGKDELAIAFDGKPIATYVMKDPDIPRPYFKSLKTLDGIQVTRNHPPVAGVDATDHPDYHPGLWMAFGDISGHDFWRNKATIRHQRIVGGPKVENGHLDFAVENALVGEDGNTIGTQVSRFSLEKKSHGFFLSWNDVYTSTDGLLIFGDQEEMGLGARMATPLTEKTSGRIRSNRGLESAKATWGQEAEWCTYSGTTEGLHAGITVFAHPDNFRPSWWHNRNYGAMVANAFGRDAMKQGEKSAVVVEPGESLSMRYGVYVHSSKEQLSLEELNEIYEGKMLKD